jgi:DNA-binding LacI/PurR family transcriptional regulator
VLAAIEELNYHPNPHAVSLAGGKSRSPGHRSNIENPFFLDLQVGRAHIRRGFDVIPANTDYV